MTVDTRNFHRTFILAFAIGTPNNIQNILTCIELFTDAMNFKFF